ncbi:MAG: glycosyltransferase family 39 protein, partial [Planctomycetota bacterium]
MKFRALLVLILLTDLAVTWIHPWADAPLHYSRDNSLTIDGYWYFAEARSWIEGQPDAQVHDSYSRPLISWPAYALFSIAGVNHASVRMLSSLGSLLTIGLLAWLVRKRYGDRWALCAAAFLALHPAWHGFVRSAVVYPWIAFWLLAVFAIAAGRSWWRWSAAVALTGGLVLTLKSIVLIALLALAIDGVRRLTRKHSLSRNGWIGLSVFGTVGALAAGPWTFPMFWTRIGRYLRGLSDGDQFDPWANFLDFESRSRLFSSAPFLVVASLASVYILVSRATRSGRDGR